MSDKKSWASSPGRRRNMQANRARDTGPELAVRKLLHAQGFRYRVHYAPLPSIRRRADIVFTRQRIAIFIDGCFWHNCPEHGHPVTVNSDYWNPKLARNHERDTETNFLLRTNGWLVLRFWAHEDAMEVCKKIASSVRAH
ncbi:very short patch repair endonuclease [Actinacidiphila epipremni]|uniref:Very short patch repair endonuclease n=1 Tax=Actinacidiphila epipremni TaxID=2053013 RepID=A0ABX0ZQ61_9ACTN|nr:very short patch repair endonuclease [Actinacidiphila epipremni]NJP46054.1 very short patch repair endonuclease [Actinacidiphila epipremni]